MIWIDLYLMEMELEKPQVGADGIYEGSGGRWTVIGTAAENLGVNERTVRLHLPEDARTLDGLDRGHREVVLYLCDEIAAAVSHVTKTAREVPSGEIYTTSTGRRYATLPVAVATLKIPLTILQNRTADVATLKARIRNSNGKLGRVSTLYCLEDFSRHPEIKGMLDTLAQEAQISDDWLTIDAFYNALPARTKKKTSKGSIRRRLVENSCTNKSAAKPGVRPGAKLYRREDLWKTGLHSVNAEIKVDKKTGFYRDREDHRWATRDMWEKKKAVTGNALNYGMHQQFGSWENTPRKRGLSMIKREDWLYQEETIDKILAFIFGAEYQLRDDGNVYKLVGETRRRVQRVYADSNVIAKEAHVSADQVRKRLSKEACAAIKAIHRRTGREVLLHDLSAARRIFAERIGIKILADDAEINDRVHGRCVRLSVFLDENGVFKDVTKAIAFQRLVKRKCPVKLRRLDKTTNRICTYYPAHFLAKIAKDMEK